MLKSCDGKRILIIEQKRLFEILICVENQSDGAH